MYNTYLNPHHAWNIDIDMVEVPSTLQEFFFQRKVFNMKKPFIFQSLE